MKRINVLLNTDKSYTYQFKSTTLYVTANSLYFYLGMLSGRNIWYILHSNLEETKVQSDRVHNETHSSQRRLKKGRVIV